MMKKLIFIVAIVLSAVSLTAQVPYFGTTVKRDNMYSYLSTSPRVGSDLVTSYFSFQYGVTNWLSLVSDISVGTGYSYQGAGVRFNFLKSKYLNLGWQTTFNFDYNKNYRYGYWYNGIFANGKIAGKFGWITNTWHYNDMNGDVWDQWVYLTYNLHENIQPYVGTTFNYEDINKTVDLAVGAYFPYKNFNFYAHGGYLFGKQFDPKLTIGVDYTFQVK